MSNKREDRQKVLDSFVWVELKNAESFSIIRETLTRVGLPSYKKDGETILSKELIQSCHILHKGGKYAITHFKEMFMLDGLDTTFSDEDRQRRNTIIQLLADWNLLTPVNSDEIADQIPITRLKVIPHSEKKDWKLVSKYVVDRTKFVKKKVD
jgi:hypothetical protein